MDKIEIPTFLKWAGGKSKLLKQMDRFFPSKIENYIEPFLGGGAVLFYCLKYRRPKKAYAYDINANLINVYIQVRDNSSKLMDELEKLEKEHNQSEDPKYVYYNNRIEFNTKIKSKIRKAALFIYLNKSCYNGLYRVNALGEFNVPFGKYAKLKIYDSKIIKEASDLLKGVVLGVKDFREIKYEKKATIYFDPPYWSESHKNGFTSYHKGDFSENDQTELRDLFLKLATKHRTLLLSNSCTKLIKSLYQRADVIKVEIDARWMINCQGENRKKLKELMMVWTTSDQ
jgi:DNA adenine methylase